MATFDNFISSLRSEFGEQGAGRKFEVFCKWFLENDPRWSKSIDKVWLWDDYPNKWQRQDLGTDLVFRDKEGLIWAVQAKCYSEHRATTKGDMNSFLADTGRKEVDRRLWLQTTNKMEAKADKTLKGQDKPVTVFNLNDFRDAQIDYPATNSELYQAKVKAKPSPDHHQVEAIDAVQTGLKTSDRGQMIMACGTGKTFTTLWIKETLKAHTTLVLLPSLSLLSQTMREWAWAGNADFEILNVCSDKSVGKKTEDIHASDAPFPVTSELTEISKFLKRPESKVIFCTYQSSPLIAEVQLDASIPTFDLTIADEAHRCAGKADAGFATVLDEYKIRSTKRLFTTATPRYFGAAIKDAAKARDLAVVGMDDETVFGPILHKLTFGQAIAKDLLNDYQVVIVGVDEPMVKQWIDEQEIVATNPDKQTDARTLAAKIGLIKAIKDYDLKRVISFHSRIKGAKEFSEELLDVVDIIDPVHRPKGVFLADYVSGIMKAGDRKDKIDRLKLLEDFDRGILSNARCLAEGVDVPSLDGVAFIDPKGSQVEIIQAVGRAIRKVRGAKVQTKGMIVIPVFIEAGDDPENSIEASKFKPVWDVLKALRAHDEILADVLDNYRTDMAKNVNQSSKSISDRIEFDIPATVDVGFSSALRTVLVEASTVSWDFWYGLLERFKEREGHCNIKQTHKEFGYALGTWISHQRITKDSLTLDRFKRLDALGIIWDPLSEQWEEGYSKLKQFKEREGHCQVKDKYKENGFKLGIWVATQRFKKVKMTSERIERLDDLGFVWDVLTEQWEEGYSKLKQFKEREGHSKVSDRYKEDGYNLGDWVSRQKTNRDSISPERIKRLDGLGFIWDALTEQWEEGYSKLKQFKEREGHCKVLRKYKESGYKLDLWVNRQRANKDSLTPDRFKRLDDLGFIWDPHSEQWEEGFAKLKQFKEREGHCKVVRGQKEDGYALDLWVGRQRQNKNNLTDDRYNRLNTMGFFTDILTDQWEEGFKKLQRFKKREGHCKVAIGYKDGDFGLGRWVRTQRDYVNNLSLERLERLNALGFIWDPITHQWEEGFKKLQQFKEREGHCRVSQGHMEKSFNLGNWIIVQRRNKEIFTPDRFKRLDDLGFIWDPQSEKWEEGFRKLQKYKLREGDCEVASGHKEDSYALGSWVSVQKINKDKLSLERLDRLNSLGFVWNKSILQWEEGFKKLQQFKEREGHCRVLNKYKEDGYNLGNWVSRQRTSKNIITPERIKKLDDLGFIWDLHADLWEEGFKMLQRFSEREGHCSIPKKYREGNYALGRWIGTQRKNKDSLTPERLERLNSLGFVWIAITDKNP